VLPLLLQRQKGGCELRSRCSANPGRNVPLFAAACNLEFGLGPCSARGTNRTSRRAGLATLFPRAYK